MRKKRLLMVNESSLLSTGYSTYGYEILRRLQAANKYEIAELASYGTPEDSRANILPWRYYPVIPTKDDKLKEKIYHSKVTNQWGEYLFDDVCLDFKPDIVFSIRDTWMDEHINRSPARRYFNYAYMPTIDSAPLNDNWLSQFSDADAIFTYTDWGMDVIRKQMNNPPNLKCSAPPGADLTNYKFLNKDEVRKRVGLSKDSFIIGTVMRNQVRKLYPDLMESFKTFLENAPREIASKSYLYLHTAYPDVGWDIPRLLKEHGIAHRTYFTYFCLNCKEIYPSFFQDGKAPCRLCGSHSAILPNIKAGIPPHVLNEIYGLMDVYVQYATCMPTGEKVFVNHEWKNIEDVRVGNIALTHTGRWMPVKEIMTNDFNGKIYEISVWGDCDKSKFTVEHPLFGLFSENIGCVKNQSLRETIGNKIRNRQELPKPTFLEVEKVKVGDLIGYTIDDSIKDFQELEGFKVDNEFCKFIGLFAADGCWSKDRVQITCHENEYKNIELSQYILNKYWNTSIRKYKNRKAIDVMSCSTKIVNIFSIWFKKHEFKQLPEWSSNLPIEKQKKIIQGLMMGDGCYVEEVNTTVYVTISKNLAYQLKNMLRRCRINFNLRLAKKTGNRKNQYRFEICGNGKTGDFEKIRKNTCNLYIDNIHYMKVKSILASEYVGKVHNFEVEEDNSYLSLIGHSHNCEGLGMPQVESAASGTPVMSVDYSAMSDVVRKINGLPIKVHRMFRDNGTESYRALPDNSDLVQLLINFFQITKEKRLELGVKAREGVLQHYTWEKTAKIWEEYFDSVIPLDKWHLPANIHVPNLNPPTGMSDKEFVNWAFTNIAGRPELIDSYLATRLTRDLGLGACLNGLPNMLVNEEHSSESYAAYGEFTREALAGHLMNIGNAKNIFEQKRGKL